MVVSWDQPAIERAVRERLSIEAIYEGVRRTFDPHVIGASATDGTTRVFAWQTRSGKPDEPGWRRFRLDGLTGLVVTERHFVPQPGLRDPVRLRFRQVYALI